MQKDRLDGVTLEEFFSVPFPQKAKGFIELRALPGGIQEFVHSGEIDQVRRFLKEERLRDLYFGVTSRRERGDGSLANCGDLWALWTDIDFKDVPESEARRLLAEFPLPPSMSIFSGGGVHNYWSLRRVVLVQRETERVYAVLRRIAHQLRADLKAAEPARVLRVPGTLNYKYGPPRRVTIELFKPERVYDLAEFEQALPEGPRRETGRIPFRVPEKILKGERNTSLHRFGRSLRARGVTGAAIFAALRAVNMMQCEPPLDEEEVGRIATNCATQADRPDFHPGLEKKGPAGPGESSESTAPILVNLADVKPEPVRWQWLRRVARRKVNLIIGDPGLGKSLAALDIAARTTRGAEWPDGGRAPRGHVIILTAEDGLADTVRPRVDALGGDATKITILQAVREGGRERGFNLAKDLTVLERVIAETRAILVIIDPLSAYLGRTNSWKDSEIRGVLSPLAVLADRTGGAVLGIMHLSKNEQRAALYRAQGSIAFVAAARSVLGIAKDPEIEDRRLLFSLKLNIGMPPPVLAFHPHNQGIIWESEPVLGVEAETLLRGHEGREKAAERNAAKVFLRELLADGEKPEKGVRKAAKDEGISPRTLRRAKAELKVLSRKTGKPGTPQAWLWSLPDAAGRGPR